MDYAVFAACTRSASINLFWRAQATYTLRLLWRQADLNRKAGSHRRWRRSRSRESASEPCQVKIKIGVVSGVISSTESESKESQWFHF